MPTFAERWRRLPMEASQAYVELKPSQQRVYDACVHLCDQGSFPTPSRLVERLHGRTGRMLNGRECAARRLFFEHLGFRRHPGTGKWYLPWKPLWRKHRQPGFEVRCGPETLDTAACLAEQRS